MDLLFFEILSLDFDFLCMYDTIYIKLLCGVELKMSNALFI